MYYNLYTGLFGMSLGHICGSFTLKEGSVVSRGGFRGGAPEAGVSTTTPPTFEERDREGGLVGQPQ